MEDGRIDAERVRVLIPMWDDQESDELIGGLQGIASLALFGYSPVVVGEVLHWHLYIQGGIATVAEALLAHAREEPVTCVVADESLEVSLDRDDPERVALLGPRTHPVIVEVDEALQLLGRHTTARDLKSALAKASFSWPTRAFEVDIEEPDDDTAGVLTVQEAEDRETLGGGGPTSFRVVPPGQIDFDMLEEASCVLVQHWDPESYLDQTYAFFANPGPRTLQFWPPGRCEVSPSDGGPDHDRAWTSWFVAECDAEDDTVLTVEPVELSTLTEADSTPDEVVTWARRETQEAIKTLRIMEIDRDLAEAAIRSFERQLSS